MRVRSGVIEPEGYVLYLFYLVAWRVLFVGGVLESWEDVKVWMVPDVLVEEPLGEGVIVVDEILFHFLERFNAYEFTFFADDGEGDWLGGVQGELVQVRVWVDVLQEDRVVELGVLWDQVLDRRYPRLWDWLSWVAAGVPGPLETVVAAGETGVAVAGLEGGAGSGVGVFFSPCSRWGRVGAGIDVFAGREVGLATGVPEPLETAVAPGVAAVDPGCSGGASPPQAAVRVRIVVMMIRRMSFFMDVFLSLQEIGREAAGPG